MLQLNFQANDLTGQSSSAQKTPTQVVDKPFIIRAAATDRALAGTLLENIKARKDLFKSADLIDVTFVESATTVSGSTTTTNSISDKYPYQITINAYFNTSQSSTAGTKL